MRVLVISHTVRWEAYKSQQTRAQKLVFTERGGLPLPPGFRSLTEPTMGSTKLCILLLLGTYTLARKCYDLFGNLLKFLFYDADQMQKYLNNKFGAKALK